jgi:hypothetical protein
MIDAIDVQRLLDDAVSKGQPQIVRLAREALEHGVGSDAWSRCQLILARDGLIKGRRGPVVARKAKLDVSIPFRLTDPLIPYRVVA